MCQTCGVPKCTCTKVISKVGPRGPKGPAGKQGIPGVTAPAIPNLPVNNTVYVMKNGNDSTGLVQRFDKPFLTIAAATTAALAFFTVRSSTERVKIVVESGYYNETVFMHDFIDYDLGNSVISNTLSSRASLSDENGTFSAVGEGEYNCIIHGNAQLLNTYGVLGIGIYQKKGSKVFANITSIKCSSGEPVAIGNGSNLLLHCNILKSENSQNSLIIQAIQMFIDTGLEATNAATLEIHGCKIMNTAIGNQTGVATCTFSSALNSGKEHKLVLVDCEVINASTTTAAINTYDDGSQFYGNLLLILKDTIIYNSSAVDSISALAASTIRVESFNSYSNRAMAGGGDAPSVIYGTLNVDAAIIV